MPPSTPVSLWPDPRHLGPITDLYQLTMMAGYAAAGMDQQRATFELFVRKLPSGRSYLVFAGLEQAVGDLMRLAFSEEHAAYLATLPAFAHVDPAWFAALPYLRFQGDVWAMPEGTAVFAGETLLRVEAPLAQAQWVETYLIASLNYATLVASKASRIVDAAKGRPCVDFGTRRGHGPHAGFIAARSAYLAGFAGTSHVEASRLLGIPAVGTMAHAWVQSFDEEQDAFASFAGTFPENSTLLVDTYDTLEGVRRAAAIEPAITGVRIDSGNLLELSRESRVLLDSLDRRHTKIIVSGDLEEHKIAALVEGQAPIDTFGVGTELITSRDAPSMSMVYKLVAIDGQGRVKLSPGKRTYPLAKQVYRRRDEQGKITGDHVTRWDEQAEGEPLLKPVLKDGKLVADLPSLAAIRTRCDEQRASLPAALRSIGGEASYPISYSDVLEDAAKALGL